MFKFTSKIANSLHIYPKQEASWPDSSNAHDFDNWSKYNTINMISLNQIASLFDKQMYFDMGATIAG